MYDLGMYGPSSLLSKTFQYFRLGSSLAVHLDVVRFRLSFCLRCSPALLLRSGESIPVGAEEWPMLSRIFLSIGDQSLQPPH